MQLAEELRYIDSDDRATKQLGNKLLPNFSIRDNTLTSQHLDQLSTAQNADMIRFNLSKLLMMPESQSPDILNQFKVRSGVFLMNPLKPAASLQYVSEHIDDKQWN